MQHDIKAKVTVNVQWSNKERKVIRGMSDEISKFHPTGPYDILDLGPYKKQFQEHELSNLNHLLGKMLEKSEGRDIVEDYNGEYDRDIVKSMFEQTERGLEDIWETKEKVSQHVDLLLD